MADEKNKKDEKAKGAAAGANTGVSQGQPRQQGRDRDSEQDKSLGNTGARDYDQRGVRRQEQHDEDEG
jgi:hypothetical protein